MLSLTVTVTERKKTSNKVWKGMGVKSKQVMSSEYQAFLFKSFKQKVVKFIYKK